MYIEKDHYTYYKGTEQRTSRGKFLILMQPTEGIDYAIRGIIRKVAMKQLGHFMMGTARIKNQSITLSGSYGNDGLTCSVPMEVYLMGKELPKWLVDLWNKGGGHNSCGNEANEMRIWAIDQLIK